MKPQPPARRKVHVPKAVGPDPAAPATAQNPSNHHNTGGVSNAGVTAKTGERLRKSTIEAPESTLARWRAAWWLDSAMNPGKYPSYKAWVSEHLEAAAADVERRYNGGEPLVPIPTGVVPTGRPWVFPL